MQPVLRADGWTRTPTAAVRGRAFDGDRLLEGRDLAERFADAAAGGLESIATAAEALEGFFGAVLESDDGTRYLIADGTRSIPLYYDAAGSVVSDRGRVVRDATDAECDPIAESEFVLTRYVTGPETIWRGVFATQPGEVVALEEGAEKPVRRTYREYWPVGPRSGSGRPSLESAFETALDRLEAVAGDRPVVVPLSGGYDSRLLAAALADRGREVIAYTFGRSGHPDVEVSREVAARLGIRWEFCEYDRERWRELYHGSPGKRYRERAFGGDALPFLAEWPALRRLLEAGRLPGDALYCPGHTVATPSERLPRFVGEAPPAGGEDVGCGPAVDADVASEGVGELVEPSLEGLVEYVLENHYVLWNRDERAREFDAAVRERIRRGLLGGRAPSAIGDPATAGAAYERWEWRGRMATFTAGDLRVYEDCGVDWWLPLWDPAYVRAWERVGLESRRGKAAHAALAREYYRRAADVPAERVALTDRHLPPADRLLALCRHTPERQFTERGGDWEPPFQLPRTQWTERGAHPLDWDGLVDADVWKRLPTFRNLYSLRVLEATGRLELTAPDAEPNFEGIAATPCDERTVD